MGSSHRKAPAAQVAEPLPLAPIFPTALLENALQAQALGLQAWLSWQRTVQEATQELWDEWRVHFAGGAPIGD